MKHLYLMLMASLLALASCRSTVGLLGPSIAELDERFITLDLFFET